MAEPGGTTPIKLGKPDWNKRGTSLLRKKGENRLNISDPPEAVDTDGDRVGDNEDAFPNDPSETADSEGGVKSDTGS